MASPSPRGAAAPAILALIAAVARNGVIGANGALPWRLPADLAHFRALTTGHTIVMGRRTWESLGRALPGRENIVVTRDHDFHAPGAHVAASLDEALDAATLPPPVFCIGGAQLYAAALPRADALHVTEIGRDYAGDTWFPAWDRHAFVETGRAEHMSDDGIPFAFVTYVRAA